MPNYTPTEQRALAIISDGQRRLKSDLLAAFNDQDQASSGALRVLIWKLRRKLALEGKYIACEQRDYKYYVMLVRLISTDDT